MDKIRIGIINVSDRASRGEYEDLPGREVQRLLNLWLSCPWEAVYAVVPDEQSLLEEQLMKMADKDACCLLVTTGGTGPAKRDVTPEATIAVSEKLLPGFGEQMRQVSLH
ncbi:MAG: molybdopterin-binding protein, partial [Bacteroidota bacterium]